MYLDHIGKLASVGIRARLFVNARIGTVEQTAKWDADEFREHIVEYVERTGFDGIPTLPTEARFSIDFTKKLPKIIGF
ncbi:MAG: hypothetical protein ISR58_02210 [Anaerolineales bacterium]|nr:hypothetical protein [Chloroflexota bacterium]MBL6979981.1 hypothetical protein [Anaerolineales bacterium]